MKARHIATTLCVALALASTALSPQARAQEIDFAALKRPSTPVIKHYTVNGTATEGYSHLQSFIRRDDERVEAYRQVFSGGGSGDSGSSSNGNTPASKASSHKQFACEVFCISGQGPTVTVNVTAGSRREAARYMDKKADEVCRKNGLSHGSNISFPDRQCQER